MMTKDELLDAVVDVYDPDEVVEVLDLSTEDIVESFKDEVWAKRRRFDRIDLNSKDAYEK